MFGKRQSKHLFLLDGLDANLPPVVGILCLLLVLVYLNNIFRLTPQLPNVLYYASVIVLNGLLLLLSAKDNIRIAPDMWLFWLLMWISIWVNIDELDASFKAPYRTISFLLVQLVVAPWFVSKQLNLSRDFIFNLLNLGILFMAELSFAGRIFHFLPTDEQGFYLGCTWHSMNLAAISGIAAIYSMHHFVQSLKDAFLRRIYAVGVAGAFLVIILSASRTVLISCIIAILGYWGAGASQRILKIIKPSLIVCLLAYVISIVMPEAFMGLAKKSIGSNEQMTMEQFAQSRSGVWLARFNEIKESPFFGVGAHSIKYGQADFFSGQIEPGNAWLYVFSSMGIFQFVLFCGMIWRAFRRVRLQAKPGRQASLIMALLIYFCFYMVGEAHITAAGEFTCIYFWLLLSMAIFHDFSMDEPKPSVSHVYLVK